MGEGRKPMVTRGTATSLVPASSMWFVCTESHRWGDVVERTDIKKYMLRKGSAHAIV